MNFSKNVLIIAICLLQIRKNCYATFVEDYCWRDYDGVIPLDALKAGIDRTGKPIYIGQVLFHNKLIPGKIHENVNEIHIQYYNAHTVNETIKVLCTTYPKKFEWLKTRYDEIFNIKNKHIFEGGYERDVSTYIGRAYSFEELTIGKVICWSAYNCLRLRTVENGTFYQHEEFEILIYNPNIIEESAAHATNNTTSKSEYPSKIKVQTKSTSFLSYFVLVLATAAILVCIIIILKRYC